MMRKRECVLGIDMGTSSVKVGLFDLQGQPMAFADASYPLYTPKSGWAEQKADEWWSAIGTAVKDVVEKSGITPDDIIGMSVDTTCCTVLVADKQMNVLAPAIMWMDMRASAQAKKMTATGHDALKYNGYGNASAESMPAKALWLKENEPELYHQAEHVFECIDWLMYQLTGELTASIDTISTRWYYNREDGGWPTSFYEEIGLEDVLHKFPQTVLDMGVNVGGLKKEAAQQLGLREGIPVGEGGADAFVGMLGLNVVAPGSIAMITGTSHLHLGLIDKEMHAAGMWGSYPDAVIPGLQLIEGGQTSTGAIVNWFKTNYCGDIAREAQEQGRSVYDLLNEEAAKLPIGAEGLLAFDYFQGNRTPYADPDVRGMFYGLSLKHTPYHLYRAILESICYGTELIMETFRKGGTKPDGIYISGGAVKSELWLKIHADVCNLPIHVPKVTEGPCLGSAILGAVAAGVYSDIATAAGSMVTIERTVEPDAQAHGEYRFFYDKYVEGYELMKGWMHSLTMHI
ncbi:MAG: FGGY-family carbohydrate kinase [Christensenella sp.]|uniref:FGGY-family carbohydrate kinase n=1 Tax=Christensenella sp. TaxID=1935934 RepID=UPI002B1F0D84|nr:FGGY-family carbohydrate kinase [Christensenella sp.]MEA5003390.1 FGGY-family carbohydrate kinase [Christensenella sp.]